MDVPLHAGLFYHDGRGPESRRIHWANHGPVLLAVDYTNHDAGLDDADLMHVRFIRSQVVMITPEEVINYGDLTDLLVRHRPAAIFDRGRSPWLQSFSPRHLERCKHFQLMFYDELFDIICEEVVCLPGPYRGESAA